MKLITTKWIKIINKTLMEYYLHLLPHIAKITSSTLPQVDLLAARKDLAQLAGKIKFNLVSKKVLLSKIPVT